MPSQPDRPALCIIGDSHLGSLRRAVDAGLVSFPGRHVEFWGATGPQFRQIDMKDGVIRARGAARDMVRKVNGHGRDEIRAGDFGTFLFYGARLRVAEFFAPCLHRQCDGVGFASRAAMETAADAFLRATRAWRMARDLAGAGAEVIFVPASFPTAQVIDHAAPGRLLDSYPKAIHATAQDRDRLWTLLCARSEGHGVTLIRQPEDTVTDGIFTDPRYAIDGARENRDAGHKSPAFAALMLGQAGLPVLRRAA